MDETERQSVIDEEHLRLLRIGYFVSAGVAAFFALFGLFYAGMGVLFGMMPHSPPSPDHGPPPPEIGWIFGLFGVAMAGIAITVALLRFRVAQALEKRTSRGLCLVMAAISCLEVPYGTVLGVFTFMVLSRPSVQKLFSVPVNRRTQS